MYSGISGVDFAVDGSKMKPKVKAQCSKEAPRGGLQYDMPTVPVMTKTHLYDRCEVNRTAMGGSEVASGFFDVLSPLWKQVGVESTSVEVSGWYIGRNTVKSVEVS